MRNPFFIYHDWPYSFIQGIASIADGAVTVVTLGFIGTNFEFDSIQWRATKIIEQTRRKWEKTAKEKS